LPILTPVLEAANFDLIWFAVILTINMEVGLITPPVGLTWSSGRAPRGSALPPC